MDVERAKEFLVAVGQTGWVMDFKEFCRRTGFVGQYAKDKWGDFRKLVAACGAFDAHALAKILTPKEVKV